MKILPYISAWLALVALTAIPGLVRGDMGDAVGYGALGVLAATLVVPGVFAVLQVRSGFSRGLGILVVAISCVLAGVLPPFLVEHSGFFSTGDAGMAVPLFFAPLAAGSGVLGFIILTFCVLFVPRKSRNAA